MTINKRKKVVKYRGSKTHGGGSMKKRRGAGHKGGRGAAGSGKRADTKKPSIWGGRYFGKFGFISKSRTRIYAINIADIEKNIKDYVSKELATEEGGKYVIDIEKLGYNKLLGSGKVLNKYTIKTVYASAKAVEKVKSAGGEVKIVTKESKK